MAKRKKFEVGVIYKRKNIQARGDSGWYLAVSNNTLVGRVGGQMIEYRPLNRLEMITGIGVLDLCEAWGVELSFIDQVTNHYLSPVSHRSKKRRGSRMKVVGAEDAGRELRTVRVAW